MQIIGLTGGIATGKSTACRCLEASGVPVIDADQLSRDVLQPGTAAYARTCRLFPDAVDAATGLLNRARLGEHIFSEPTARRQLEEIVHPLVKRAIFRSLFVYWLRGCDRVVLEVPLLFETRLDRWMSLTVVVAASLPVQIERLQQRNGLNADQARARISAQLPLDQKCKLASVVIRNDGDIQSLGEELREKILARPPNPVLHCWLYHHVPIALFLAALAAAVALLFPKNR